MHHRGRTQIPLVGLPVAYSSNRIGPYRAIRSAFACPRGAAFFALWISVNRSTAASWVANPDSSNCRPAADR
ncbi:hypothetical protein [Streptomyces sp. S.PNR 29]|uniref:hypothetical protein n=1 Tax=Streptomyces sp. S.PNR 29 TaxID=2973805 RepID=UPI0025B19809|nr:hypothetical protein [Streptomyces sp. S.PNR 29]MDN0201232.1 hypothetical protein [Streptomyces sp. S.PNR 29]